MDDKIKTPQKLSRAILNELTDALEHGNTVIENVHQRWIDDNVMNALSAYPLQDTGQSHKISELINELKDRGMPADSIVLPMQDRYAYYDERDKYKIKFANCTVFFEKTTQYRNRTHEEAGFRAVIPRKYTRYECTSFNTKALADALQEIDAAITEWNAKIWEPAILEAQKKAKKKSMSENTIEILLKAKMKGLDIPYSIVKQKLRVKAYFDVGHNVMMEMYISHKRFAEQIDTIIATAVSMKKMMDETDVTFKVKKTDTTIKWTE